MQTNEHEILHFITLLINILSIGKLQAKAKVSRFMTY